MQITLSAGAREGCLALPPSKSIAHRKIILAALAPSGGDVCLTEISNDIQDTLNLVETLGSTIAITEKNQAHHIKIGPIPKKIETPIHIHVTESATTLRIALILAPTLAEHITFTAGESLAARPMDEGIRFLKAQGVQVKGPWPIVTTGRLRYTQAEIEAQTTGQFATGALIAALTQPRPIILRLKHPASMPYIRMTAQMITEAGVKVEEKNNTFVVRQGEIHAASPHVEGDRSHAAAFIVANDMGSAIRLENLDPQSLQGDKEIHTHINAMKEHKIVDLTHHPDLLMALAVLATKYGATFTGIRRLRTKETDRIATTAHMLRALGIATEITDDRLIVAPGTITAGIVDTAGDHRIAFAAFAAACAATGPITLKNPEAVKKSWPGFYAAVEKLTIRNKKP